MKKPSTTFVSTMDLGATMHKEVIYAATFKDSSTYTGSSRPKLHIFDLSQEITVSSRHDTYTTKTNVERLL
jgi:hypothetical protein